MQACLNKADDERPAPDALADDPPAPAHEAFKPAFLGRMKVAPFYPITDAVLADHRAEAGPHPRQRIASNHKAVFEYDDALVEAVLARCTEVDSGARNVDTS
jgi:type VI secretion system protein VasG